MIKKFSSLILVATLIFASACSNEPSMSEIRQQLENILIENGEDRLFNIEDLERLEGTAQGDNAYRVAIKYKLVFKTSLQDYKQDLKHESGSPIQSLVNALRILNLRLRYGNFEQGSKIDKSETYTFYKTDAGWSLEQNPELDKDSRLAETHRS